MLKAFKYRIYPNKSQAELINKHIGSARFIYNLALETKKTIYDDYKVSLSGFDLINQLPELKKDYDWLKEITAQSLQASIRNLDQAYKNFFKGHNKFPKFKSKWKGKQSYTIPSGVKIGSGKLNIPKFREGIKIVMERPVKGQIKSATISRTPTGKYYVSILCETHEACEKKSKVKESTTVGLDLGLTDFLTTSDGDKVGNPRFMKKMISKLKYIQRKYSKYKGKRTKYMLAKIHEKIASQRKDFLHKLSSTLVKENHSIAVEDLNVKNMKSRCKPKIDTNGKYLPNGQSAKSGLNSSISDVGWGMFIEMLKYKCEWYGVNFLQIDRFDASSKLCSNSKCDYKNSELKLSDRKWKCPNCYTEHDRDVNAAINIKIIAIIKYLSGTDRENQDELPVLAGVLTPEALN